MCNRLGCIVLSLLLVTVVAGCGGKKPEEEMRSAQNALQRAREAEAPQWASQTYTNAQASFDKGQSLVQQRKNDEAREAFLEAERLADQSIDEAEAAIAQAEEKAAESEAMAEPVDEKPAEKRTHTVVKGECLWYIAGYGDVYGDPYQWSRLYNANSGVIADPDLIYPGQELAVVR